jgi:hypothetical protein
VRRHRLVVAVAAPLVIALAGVFAAPVSATVAPHAWAFGEWSNGSSLVMLIEKWNGTKWAYEAAPTIPNTTTQSLKAAVATSATNVWAVGQYATALAVNSLIVNWNGSTWSPQVAPHQGAGPNTLYGIAALSASNAWAVGSYLDAQHNAHTLILHWNGSKWSVQSSPNKGGFYSELTSVTAISNTNVWAFGYYGTDTIDKGLALHWNGTKWSLATVPTKGTTLSNYLYGASSTAAKDVWSVGSAVNPVSGNQQTLALHKTAAGWGVVTTPNVNSTNDQLAAVTSITSTNAWAVGSSVTMNTGTMHLIHWNGMGWATKAVPAGLVSNSLGYGIFALSATDVWAVGVTNTGGPNGAPLVIHYNGSHWAIQQSDNPTTHGANLTAVAAVP